MNIISVLLEILHSFEKDQISQQTEENIREYLESASASITENPRENTDGNGIVLWATLILSLASVEHLYGDGEETAIFPTPIFIPQANSQIAPLVGEPNKIGVGLGSFVRTWEEAFYEICHEAVHLLNPVLNVRSASIKVSALEEGVAVKFAESMYGKFIKPFCSNIPATSPISNESSQYFKAFSATNKIPDHILRDVRADFGRFSAVADAQKFKRHVGPYIKDSEVEILISPMRYFSK